MRGDVHIVRGELDGEGKDAFERTVIEGEIITADAVDLPCALHKSHSPAHLTIEFHHIIPVAWQQFWQPTEPWPFPGTDPAGRGKLWDARTMMCCPTGHRNVHHDLVAFMKAPHTHDPQSCKEAVKGKGAQYDAAFLALERFTAIGGDIVALATAREWGQS